MVIVADSGDQRGEASTGRRPSSQYEPDTLTNSMPKQLAIQPLCDTADAAVDARLWPLVQSFVEAARLVLALRRAFLPEGRAAQRASRGVDWSRVHTTLERVQRQWSELLCVQATVSSKRGVARLVRQQLAAVESELGAAQLGWLSVSIERALQAALPRGGDSGAGSAAEPAAAWSLWSSPQHVSAGERALKGCLTACATHDAAAEAILRSSTASPSRRRRRSSIVSQLPDGAPEQPDGASLWRCWMPHISTRAATLLYAARLVLQTHVALREQAHGSLLDSLYALSAVVAPSLHADHGFVKLWTLHAGSGKAEEPPAAWSGVATASQAALRSSALRPAVEELQEQLRGQVTAALHSAINAVCGAALQRALAMGAPVLDTHGLVHTQHVSVEHLAPVLDLVSSIVSKDDGADDAVFHAVHLQLRSCHCIARLRDAMVRHDAAALRQALQRERRERMVTTAEAAAEVAVIKCKMSCEDAETGLLAALEHGRVVLPKDGIGDMDVLCVDTTVRASTASL